MDHQGNKRPHAGAEEDQGPSKRQEAVQPIYVHDSIVARSLSHMSLLDAVRTTETFGDKWLSMPRLVFNDLLVYDLNHDNDRIDEAITAVLQHHQASLEELEFTITQGPHHERIPELLSYFAKRNPIFMKIIKLESPEPISITMKSLSPFKQLKELNLKGCELIDAEGCNLEQLKLLHLGDVRVPTLRKVLLGNPGLLSLALLGKPTKLSAESKDSLQLGEFVSLLPNVQVLSIWKPFSTLLVLSGGPPNGGIFNHLVSLNICMKVQYIHHLKWAFCMLKASPNLKRLGVTFVDDYEVAVEEKVQSKNYLESEKDLECLRNLTRFNISNLKSDPDDINVGLIFIQKLLNHTPNLEIGNASSRDFGYADEAILLRQLLKMKRLSPNAELYSSVLDLPYLE